jgi:Carbohydrate-selective porin, OprB family/S-layer homology domain
MTKGFLAAFKLSPVIATTIILMGSNALASLSISSLDDDPCCEYEGMDAESKLICSPSSSMLYAQVTSVSQLSDVQPTDWAFQALQSLIERYGAIAGYPDGTFRGNRAMTRYEFAAALNAALVRINELIAAGLKERVSDDDLATLQRLRTDFAPELATLTVRIDRLEAQTAELEANQFSTTTKLTGFISFNLDGAISLRHADAIAPGNVRVERIDPTDSSSVSQRGRDGRPIVTKVENDPNITFGYFGGLFLTTSFTGKDTLATTLLAGNGNSPTNAYTSAGLSNTFGVPVLDLTPSTTPSDLILGEIFYSFPVSKTLQLTIAPLFFWPRYFDTNAFTSAFGKGAGGFNTFGSTLIQDLGRSTGAVMLWRINEQFEFRFGYAANADAAIPTRGLFDSTRAATAQLTYSPISNINLRFIYDYSIIKPVDGQIKNKPIIGIADDGFGGALDDATANSFGFNFDWLVTPKFGIFGRYTYSNTNLNPVADGLDEGNLRAQSFQVGVAFPDLGKRGALATLTYVQPFDLLAGRKFLVSGGGDGGNQFDIEANYYYPVTNNIAIVPYFYVTGNPNNFDDNPLIYSGTFQVQFSF